jgi:Diguanylate cyclase, GGDEF domain
MTDSLTELANRRAFDELLEMEAAAFARREVPFCLVRIDVDRFKSVNDVHGHEAGDLLPAGFAGATRSQIATPSSTPQPRSKSANSSPPIRAATSSSRTASVTANDWRPYASPRTSRRLRRSVWPRCSSAWA